MLVEITISTSSRMSRPSTSYSRLPSLNKVISTWVREEQERVVEVSLFRHGSLDYSSRTHVEMTMFSLVASNS